MPDFTIKGNPGEIRSRGQTCADKGRLFDQTGDALTKIDTQGWIGRAADNFRDAHDREPNRWYEAGTGFRAAGNALIDYAAALEVAQAALLASILHEKPARLASLRLELRGLGVPLRDAA